MLYQIKSSIRVDNTNSYKIDLKKEKINIIHPSNKINNVYNKQNKSNIENNTMIKSPKNHNNDELFDPEIIIKDNEIYSQINVLTIETININLSKSLTEQEEFKTSNHPSKKGKNIDFGSSVRKELNKIIPNYTYINK